MKTSIALLNKLPKLVCLLGALSLPLSGLLNAQEDAPEMPAEVEAAVSAEALAAPALAPATAAVEAEVEYAEGYLEMVAEHGEYAFAFDFFVTSMLWTVIAAALVFLMHLGFSVLEAGLTRQKNTVNILMKNVFIISVGILTYAFVGFNTHYPGDFNGFISIGGPIGDLNEYFNFGYGGVGLAMTGYGDFIFQAMFAATAATIVSGAVAERIKLGSFFILAFLLVAFAYPIAGSWHWGGGYLGSLGTGAFYDFAGSSAVHAFGGFAALGAVVILGPRRGKYLADGKMRPIPGHNMPLAAIGVFLLWFGWFGFNGGSVLSAEPKGLGLVFTTTSLSASAGAIGAIFFSWILLKKPDLSMSLNGILAGLVGITAGADAVTPMNSVLIGLIAGILVVGSIIFFDKVKVDDPVGAISVHGVCGIYGTVIIAFFNPDISFVSQVIGTLSFSIFAFVVALVLAVILKSTLGLRVSEEEEEDGLDLGEHGQEAYPDLAKSSAS